MKPDDDPGVTLQGSRPKPRLESPSGRRPDHRQAKRCGLLRSSWQGVCAQAPGRSNDKSESIRAQGFVSLMNHANRFGPACRVTRYKTPVRPKKAERD